MVELNDGDLTGGKGGGKVLHSHSNCPQHSGLFVRPSIPMKFPEKPDFWLRTSNWLHGNWPTGGSPPPSFRNLLFQLSPFIAVYIVCIVFMTRQGNFCDAIVARNAEGQGWTGRIAPVPDLRFGFSASELLATLSLYGDLGRTKYASAELVDFVYMGCYTVIFAGIAGFLARKAVQSETQGIGRVVWMSNLLPLFALFFDFLENFGIEFVLRNAGWKNDRIIGLNEANGAVVFAAQMAGIVGKFKWLSIYCLLACFVVSLSLWARRAVRIRVKKE